MKHRYFFLISFLLMLVGVQSARAQKMVVKTTDNQFVKFDVSNVDYVTFIEEYVDLGLPSGTLWATCNLGAEVPEQYGYFYAWGETKTKSNYSWSTYKHCNGSSSTLTKYSDR